MTLKSRPKDRVLPLRAITCQCCGKVEMRKSGAAKYCFVCADALTTKRNQAKNTGLPRAKKRVSGSPRSRNFIGPPKPTHLNFFTCIRCLQILPIAEKGAVQGKTWTCAACVEKISKQVAYIRAHPKQQQKWTEWRLEKFLRFLDKNGG